MSQKIKQIIIALVIIVIAFIGFQKFFAPETDQALVKDQNKEKFVDGQAILALLNRLNKVTLDEGIFTSAVFNSLVSFERTIPDQPIARPNPFAPIGKDI
jgi:hypothetical protein